MSLLRRFFFFKVSVLGRQHTREKMEDFQKKKKMEDFQAAEETAFVVDEVSSVVEEATESDIDGSTYQHSKVNQCGSGSGRTVW